MFMGSNSMKNIIEKLDGDIEYIDRKIIIAAIKRFLIFSIPNDLFK